MNKIETLKNIVKEMEKEGWEVLMFCTVELGLEKGVVAEIVKDDMCIYFDLSDKTVPLMIKNYICPSCGEDREALGLSIDYCPQCENEFVIKKEIDDEYFA